MSSCYSLLTASSRVLIVELVSSPEEVVSRQTVYSPCTALEPRSKAVIGAYL
jgi:hypothetical protein